MQTQHFPFQFVNENKMNVFGFLVGRLKRFLNYYTYRGVSDGLVVSMLDCQIERFWVQTRSLAEADSMLQIERIPLSLLGLNE